jgi:hypothetical protein
MLNLFAVICSDCVKSLGHSLWFTYAFWHSVWIPNLLLRCSDDRHDGEWYMLVTNRMRQTLPRVRSESRCALMKGVGSDVHLPQLKEPQWVKTELNKHFTAIARQPLFNSWIQWNNSTFQRQHQYWQPNLRTVPHLSVSAQRLSERNVHTRICWSYYLNWKMTNLHLPVTAL